MSLLKGVYIITNVGASSTTDLGPLSRFIQVLAGIGDHMVVRTYFLMPIDILISGTEVSSRASIQQSSLP
jgi:hypothetical protein